MGAVRMICKHCKGDDVRLDAYAYWDIEAQEWALASTYDAAFCVTCDGDCRIDEVPIAQPTEVPA